MKIGNIDWGEIIEIDTVKKVVMVSKPRSSERGIW